MTVKEVQSLLRRILPGITNYAIGKSIKIAFPKVKRSFSGSRKVNERVSKYYGMRPVATLSPPKFSSTPMPPLLVIDDIVNRLQTPTGKLNKANNRQRTGTRKKVTSLPKRFHVSKKDIKLTTNIVGQGGFGTVFDAVLEGKDAVAKQFTDTESKECVKREAEITARIKHHRNVVEFLGVCIDERPFYLITRKYVCNGEAQTIFSALRDDILKKEVDWVKVAKQVGEGLMNIHESGVVHNDLKGKML